MGSSSAPDNKLQLCQVLSSIVIYNRTQWPCSTRPVPRGLSDDGASQRKTQQTDIRFVSIVWIICFPTFFFVVNKHCQSCQKIKKVITGMFTFMQ